MYKYFLIIIYTFMISTITYADTFILGSGLEKDSPDYIRTQKTVSEIFRRAGNHTVQIINLPAERSLIKANSGQIDGDVIRVKGAEKDFENLTIVEEPLTTIEVSAYTLNPEIKTITLSE